MAESLIPDRLHEPTLAQGSLVGGKFVVKRFLAQGGMGRVYVAEQQPMARKVALKVMRRDLADDEGAVRRFLQEAVAVSKLQHPNTVTLFDYGESADGALYIAMEYLDGLSLKEVLTRDRRLPLARTTRIVAQVALSLAEAHRKGIIHRDLKPDNIFLSSVDGRPDFVKVIDFGIAHLQSVRPESRITQAGFVCGTPEYMSPEQARGEEIDARADLYSLGVIIYELLEGELPFDAGTPLGIVLKHQSERPPPLTGRHPPAFVDLVTRLMAKHRRDRPENAEALLNELQRALPGGVGLTGLEIEVGRVHRETLPAARSLAERRDRGAPVDTAAKGLDDTLLSTPTERERGDLSTQDAIAEARLPRSASRRGLWALLLIVALAVAYALWPSPPDSQRPAALPAFAAEGTGEAVIEETAVGEGSGAFDEVEPFVFVDVTLTSEPARARLHIDGSYRGLTPLALELTPEQRYDVLLTYDDYQDLQRELLVSAEQRGQTIGPWPLTPSPASIRITTDPEGVEVFDADTGESWGQTELTRDVPRSSEPLTLRFERDRYRTTERTVTPDEGSVALHVEMSRERRVQPEPEPTDPEPTDESPFGPPVD